MLDFKDIPELNTTTLYRRFKKEIETDWTSIFNNETKVTSAAWLAAFKFRRPERIIQFTCETCKVVGYHSAKYMFDSEIMGDHIDCKDWYTVNADTEEKTKRPATNGELYARLETLELRLERLETLVDNLTIK